MNSGYDFQVPNNLFKISSKAFVDNSAGLYYNKKSKKIELDYYCEDPRSICKVISKPGFPIELGEKLTQAVTQHPGKQSSSASYTAYSRQIIEQTIQDQTQSRDILTFEEDTIMNPVETLEQSELQLSNDLATLVLDDDPINDGASITTEASNISGEVDPFKDDGKEIDKFQAALDLDTELLNLKFSAQLPTARDNFFKQDYPPNPTEVMGSVMASPQRLSQIPKLGENMMSLVNKTNLLTSEGKIGQYLLTDAFVAVRNGFGQLTDHIMKGFPLDHKGYWCLEHLVLAICLREKINHLLRGKDLDEDHKTVYNSTLDQCSLLLGPADFSMIEILISRFVASYKEGEFHAYKNVLELKELSAKVGALIKSNDKMWQGQETSVRTMEVLADSANHVFTKMPDMKKCETLVQRLSEMTATIQTAVRSFSASKFEVVQPHLDADYGPQPAASAHKSDTPKDLTLEEEFAEMYSLVYGSADVDMYCRHQGNAKKLRDVSNGRYDETGLVVLNGIYGNWKKEAYEMLTSFPLLSARFGKEEGRPALTNLLSKVHDDFKRGNYASNSGGRSTPVYRAPLSKSPSVASYVDNPIKPIDYD